MTRHWRLWRTAAALFVVINVFGAVYAGAMGEVRHGLLHVGLLAAAAAVWIRFRAARGDASGQWGSVPAVPGSSDFMDRLRDLEQSVEAVAIEVERIGEGQRFMTMLLTDRDSPPASGGGDRAPEAIEPNRSSP